MANVPFWLVKLPSDPTKGVIVGGTAVHPIRTQKATNGTRFQRSQEDSVKSLISGRRQTIN